MGLEEGGGLSQWTAAESEWIIIILMFWPEPGIQTSFIEILEWPSLEKVSHYLLWRPIKSNKVFCRPVVVGGYCQHRWISLWVYSKNIYRPFSGSFFLWLFGKVRSCLTGRTSWASLRGQRVSPQGQLVFHCQVGSHGQSQAKLQSSRS